MVAPQALAGGEHTVFVSGNDAAAKAATAEVLKSFGWKDVLDLGDISSARGPEMYMAMWLRLWGATGTRHDQHQGGPLTDPPPPIPIACSRPPPARFIDERKRIVAALKSAGRKDYAKAVEKIPRPSLAVWTVNQIARRDPELLRRASAPSRIVCRRRRVRSMRRPPPSSGR